MSDVTQLRETILRDYEQLKTALADNKKELADKIANGISELNARLEKAETALNRSAAVETLNEKLEETKSRSAFRKFVRTGDASELATRAGNTSTPANGGYAVPTVLESTISRLLVATSAVRSVANVVTIGGQTQYTKNISKADAAGGWVAETGARDVTDNPTLGQIVIPAHEVYANPEATNALIADAAFDIESWYVAEVADKLARLENTAFVSGDGSGKPKGFLSYTRNNLASNAADYTKLNYFQSAGAKAIGTADMYNVFYAVHPEARARGVWVLSSFWLKKAMALKDANSGQPLWSPSLIAGQPDTLLGRPVYEFADMPSTDTGTGSPVSEPIMAVFGDFKRAYTVVDRVGLTTLRDPFSHKGFVQFYTYKRVGGGAEDLRSIAAISTKQA